MNQFILHLEIAGIIEIEHRPYSALLESEWKSERVCIRQSWEKRPALACICVIHHRSDEPIDSDFE